MQYHELHQHLYFTYGTPHPKNGANVFSKGSPNLNLKYYTSSVRLACFYKNCSYDGYIGFVIKLDGVSVTITRVWEDGTKDGRGDCRMVRYRFLSPVNQHNLTNYEL